MTRRDGIQDSLPQPGEAPLRRAELPRRAPPSDQRQDPMVPSSPNPWRGFEAGSPASSGPASEDTKAAAGPAPDGSAAAAG